jgi:hypothetical protein
MLCGLNPNSVYSVSQDFLPMSSSLQTLIALGLVALALAFLLRSWFGKKKNSSGCDSAGCTAVSPEVKKLQAKLKK